LLIAKAIDSYACDSEQIFTKAGLDYSRLRDPVARFSFPAVRRLWVLACEATEDPCFGLTVAKYWHPTTLHALGYSWLASNNLEEAFERAVRYSRIINTAANGILKTEKSVNAYRLIIDTNRFNPPPVPASIEAAMAMLIVMTRAAYGEEFRPLRVSLQSDKPACADRIRDFYRAPVSFSQAENALWLDPEVASRPLATANPELVRINDRIVTDYLAQLDRSDVTMRVKSELIGRLSGGRSSEEDIATSLNISQRTLQRKLREQGKTFTGLLETTRRELSLQYVRDPQYSFSEITFLLGFTEPGNFSRAFKRWYGKSPTQFRNGCLS
ncbi:MAG: AraC family transcriptional regulator, partial [Aestuariibacter sp.]|nr:AraC family transcriptional regulator [Aestuariibacter sp.]